MLSLEPEELESEKLPQWLNCKSEGASLQLKRSSVDAIVMRQKTDSSIVDRLHEAGIHTIAPEGRVRLLSLRQLQQECKLKSQTARFALHQPAPHHPTVVLIQDELPADWEVLLETSASAILFAPTEHRVHASRRFFDWLQENDLEIPVILNFRYDCSLEDLVIQASAECGALLADGLGEGVCLEGPYTKEQIRSVSFTLLQAARMRTTRTDFISCPSCGRTLFDLQQVTARIRARTAHLPGVKIAIMGCIVNGPGEMADADFGYVGSKPGKIDLYVGKECVERNIDFAQGDDRLVDLIKAHGRWVEPVEEEQPILQK